MQLLQSRRSVKKSARRRRLAVWCIVGLVLAAGWMFRDPALQRYRSWKQQRALAQARDFIEKRDAPNAQLALDVALKAVPGNVETIRVAADMLEQVGAPQAMRLRRAVAQLAPDSAEDAAKLVLSCLRFRDFNAARDALADASPEISVQVPMLKAALAYALTTSDAPVADLLFRELKKNHPDDAELRHAHAMLHLRHPQEARRAAALAELAELAKTRPDRALQVERELAGQALQARDYRAARKHIDAILANPGATFGDRLQKANLDLLVDKVPFATVFAEFAPQAAGSPADVVQFARWLLVQGRAEEADRWLASLPEALRGEQSVRAAEAEAVGQLKDWDRLAPLLEAGAWGPVPAEAVKLAMSARLVAAQGDNALRFDLWNAAMRAAGPGLPAIGVLQRLAALWEWEREGESTLWTLARTYPDQTWAHQALFNAYKRRKDTAGMREVLVALRQSNAVVSRYQHDWALLTLLIDPSLTWNPAKETMQRLYEDDRSNPTYATGYAFALAQADRWEEALAVVETMAPEQREYPPRLPYLAFVHGMARNPDEVQRLQKLSAKSGAEYLPEERHLFTRARDAAMRPAAKSAPRRDDETRTGKTPAGAISPDDAS